MYGILRGAGCDDGQAAEATAWLMLLAFACAVWFVIEYPLT